MRGPNAATSGGRNETNPEGETFSWTTGLVSSTSHCQEEQEAVLEWETSETQHRTLCVTRLHSASDHLPRTLWGQLWERDHDGLSDNGQSGHHFMYTDNWTITRQCSYSQEMHTEVFRGKMLKHLDFTSKYFNINTEFFKRGGSFAKTITKKNEYKWFKFQKSKMLQCQGLWFTGQNDTWRSFHLKRPPHNPPQSA